MTTTAPSPPAHRSPLRDLSLIGRQLYYEQLSFWHNRFGAIFTLVFSLIFLVLTASSGAGSESSIIHAKYIQYEVPAFAAYGVMSACFSTLAISLVVRRETGLLKRLRLSPLPTWIMFGALLLNSLVVSVIEVVILVGVGKFGYHVHLPNDIAAFVVAVVIGALSFTAIGVAVSSVVPNQEAAGPMVSIVFFVLLFLSGLWSPLAPGSGLARVSDWLPVRRFILATFEPFDGNKGVSPWDWKDLKVVAIWGVLAAIMAVRRFRWEPHRS